MSGRDGATATRHARISEQLAAEIAAGTWPIGAALPSEPDLARRFGVSRMTVRQALATLADQGTLVRQRGRATRIAAPPIAQPLGRFYAFAPEMDRRGLAHSSRVLRVGLTKPTPAIRDDLGLAASEPIAQISLLRLLDGEPLMIETASFRQDLLPTIAQPEAAERSLYDLLAAAGVLVTRAIEAIRPLAIPAAQARTLNVGARALGFQVRRRSFSDTTPIEVRETVVRGDRYYFVAELARDDLFTIEHRDDPQIVR